MHLMYGLSAGNALKARRLYQDRFPGRRIPHHTTFCSIDRRLREYGSFKLHRECGRPSGVTTPEVEERILEKVAYNQRISIRTLARESNVSGTTVWRILNTNRLYPYHLQRVQGLSAADFPNRMQFSQWFLHKLIHTPNFSSSIIFTDESTFTRNGIINFHNMHLWAEENPHGILPTRYQRQFSFNVWACILGDRILGPYFLPTRLNGEVYLGFLQEHLCEMLEDIDLQTRRQLWFMHDGAPAHFHRAVRAYLDERFNHQWIGRGGPVAWPPRSPDLNPLDFYLWGHLKNMVYHSEVTTPDELRERIQTGFDHLRNMPGICQRVRSSLSRRLAVCIESNGGHFEHLL